MQCFHCTGVEVPESVLKAVTMRYSDKEGHVRFDDFVSCYVKLKSMMSEFPFISWHSLSVHRLSIVTIFLSGIAIKSSDADLLASKKSRELQA